MPAQKVWLLAVRDPMDPDGGYHMAFETRHGAQRKWREVKRAVADLPMGGRLKHLIVELEVQP